MRFDQQYCYRHQLSFTHDSCPSCAQGVETDHGFLRHNLGLLNKAIYPDSPGYQDTDTSIAAAESVTEDAATIRDRCYVIFTFEPHTADEVAYLLGLSAFTVRPRVTELNQQGLIEDTGERRKNSSGRKAIVWQLRKEETGQARLF